MKRCSSVSAALVFWGLAMPACVAAQNFSQLQGSPAVRIVQSIETPFLFGSLLGRPTCDAEENVYIRPLRNKEDPLKSIVSRISTTNLSVTMFKPAEISAFADSEPRTTAFAVTARGDVYETVLSANKESADRSLGLYLVDFAGTGEVRRLTKMGFLLVPETIAIFPDGKVFLSGTVPTKLTDSNASTSQDPSHIKSFAGIFNLEGHLLFDLSAPQDGPKESVNPNDSPADLTGLKIEDATVSFDGYLYLLRGGYSFRVEVWTENGVKRNEFAIAPPKAGWSPIELRTEDLHFVVRFQQNPKKPNEAPFSPPREVTYDLNSGATLNSVEILMPLSLTICRTNKRMILLSNHNGHFSIIKAEIYSGT